MDRFYGWIALATISVGAIYLQHGAITDLQRDLEISRQNEFTLSTVVASHEAYNAKLETDLENERQAVRDADALLAVIKQDLELSSSEIDRLRKESTEKCLNTTIPQEFIDFLNR